ncbi:hypothetical protein R50071_48980 [Halioxenophilus aromaticivorans]
MAKLLPIAATVLLCACGGGGGGSNSSNSSNTGNTPDNTTGNNDSIAAQYQGTWLAEAYGSAFKIEDDSLALYRFTNNYCFLEEQFSQIDNEDVQRALRINDSGQMEWYSQNGDADFGAPSHPYNAASDLPAACLDGLEPVLGQAGYDNSAAYVYDVFRDIFSQYFVDLEKVGATWHSLADELRYQLPESADDDGLIAALDALLAPLADTHNYVELPNGQSLRSFTKPTLDQVLISEALQLLGITTPVNANDLTSQQIDDITYYVDSELELIEAITLNYAEQPEDIQRSDNGLVTWFSNQGIGYLHIAAMTGYGDDDAAELDDLASTESAIDHIDAIMDQALTDLADVSALIIDVRTNGGGNDYISLAIASRFAQQDVLAYRKQARLGSARTEPMDVVISPRGNMTYAGPVYLLVSPNTVSAAETFTLAMSAMSQVTLVGEATHGAFSDVLEWTLPNGLHIGLSNEFYLTPEGQWLEGQGVPVDITVPSFSLEARANHQDDAIEAVLEQL